jgi:hypothetical protein
MKTSFEKFMASSAVQSIEPVKVEMSEVKVQLAMDDITELVSTYYQITDNAQSKAKGILSSLREVMAVYDNALKQESFMQSSKVTLEKMANDFKAMGITVKPSEWKEYRDLLTALNDIKTIKQQSASIQKAISLLG